MKNEEQLQPDAARLAELIEDIEVAMLTSVGPDSSLVSRPLVTLQADRNGDLWFFTRGSSGKVDDIHAHPQVNLSYAKPESGTYVSVVGTAEVLRDRQRIEELWRPSAGMFFPQGKDDPDLRLLRVRVESAEYWDRPDGILQRAVSLMHAVTGGGPESMGEHDKLDMRGR